MITMSIFWMLVLALFRMSHDSMHERPERTDPRSRVIL